MLRSLYQSQMTMTSGMKPLKWKTGMRKRMKIQTPPSDLGFEVQLHQTNQSVCICGSVRNRTLSCHDLWSTIVIFALPGGCVERPPFWSSSSPLWLWLVRLLGTSKISVVYSWSSPVGSANCALCLLQLDSRRKEKWTTHEEDV